MKRWPFRFLLGLLLSSFAIVALYVFWTSSLTPFDVSAFYSLLNFLAALILVGVTAAYVLTTKRYVDLFEQDTKTRQATQEEWEMRRFYANRLFTIGDGLVELFFASKHELEVLIHQDEGLAQSLTEIQQAAIASIHGPGSVPAATQSRVSALWDSALVRYNERAKDYNWRAQVLIHQAKALLPEEQYRELTEIFQTLSRNFYTMDDGRAVLNDYERLLPNVSRLVQSVHSLAVSKVGKQ